MTRAPAWLPLVVLLAAAASAHDNAAWQQDRAERFAAFKASHPPQEAALAENRQRTEALIAAYRPPGGPILDQPPIVWRTQADPLVVFDVAVGPRMVVVPAGEFTLGSPATEPGHRRDEAPRRRVRLGRAFAVSMFPITYGEYAWFVHVTGHKSAVSCLAPEGGAMRLLAGRNWENPGFAQVFRSPATCIGFGDALAYAAWLSRETGQRYRLLSEAEYEYANRAGTATAYWWGDAYAAGCKLVRGSPRVPGPAAVEPSTAAPGSCDDGFAFTAPLDQSRPNGFGLYDTTGNVASWTADCWHASHVGSMVSGMADSAGNCRWRAVRGGSWASPPDELRAAARTRASSSEASAARGFRVARDLQ